MIPNLGPERDRLIAAAKGECYHESDNPPRMDDCGEKTEYTCKHCGTIYFDKPYPYSSDPALCMELAQELAQYGRWGCDISLCLRKAEQGKSAVAVFKQSKSDIFVDNTEGGPFLSCVENVDLAAAFCDAVTEAWLRVIGRANEPAPQH